MNTLEDIIKAELEEVKETLARILCSKNQNMQKIMDWTLSGQGKMLRPKFLLLCSHLGEECKDSTEYAALLEIVHLASLIHDDVIDNADMRRKKESVQKKFGKKMAVYAGDFMIFSALKNSTIADRDNFHHYFDLFEDICYGELGQNDLLYNENITEEQYMSNIKGKTAAMFRTACKIGATISNCGESVINAVTTYGETIGTLFQIHDDLLDCYISDKITGKPAFQDVQNGIYTLPVLYMLENDECKAEFLELRDTFKKKITKKQIKQILDLIIKTNSLERCKEKAASLYNNAKSAISILPECEVSDIMNSYADDLYNNIAVITEK